MPLGLEDERLLSVGQREENPNKGWKESEGIAVVGIFHERITN